MEAYVDLYLAVMGVPIAIAITFNMGNLILRSMFSGIFKGWLKF